MKKEGAISKANQPTNPSPRRRFLSLWLLIVGLTSLSYVLGAAVMFFELPTAQFMARAFISAGVWNEARQASWQLSDQEDPLFITCKIDKPGKAFDGFTLCAGAKINASNTQAFLVNMRGEVVHKWEISVNDLWSDSAHTQGLINDSMVCFFSCRLFVNGDLLVVLHGMDKVAHGYGLIKLDKDSKVIWKYAGHVHHDVDVGEDGTIYAIQHERCEVMPKGLESIPTPCLVDYLVLLSPEGKLLRKPIPILEAFRDSVYSACLTAREMPRKKGDSPGLTRRRFDEDLQKLDILHTNFVQVLSRELAPKFPRFKAGQVLISLRNLDTVAVMDAEKGSVVWAARGPWRAQHDSQFLPNGHLLIFDNRGLTKRSRVLEYDPQYKVFPWSFSGENGAAFYTKERGMSQRLPNGNTLIVNSEDGEILEVTRSKELVWSCSINRYLNMARRYSRDQLPFLKGARRAR